MRKEPVDGYFIVNIFLYWPQKKQTIKKVHAQRTQFSKLKKKKIYIYKMNIRKYNGLKPSLLDTSISDSKIKAYDKYIKGFLWVLAL